MARRLRHTFIGLLGVVAILIATLAPTVSEVLAASHAASPADAVQRLAHDDACRTADDAFHDTHEQACDYCGLLAHAPPLPFAERAASLAASAIEHRAAVRFETLRRPFIRHLAQPRAPPARLVA
jgi:hypothetical protein